MISMGLEEAVFVLMLRNGELSRSMQIVFLTHHDHLVPLAKEVLGSDLNVVQL